MIVSCRVGLTVALSLLVSVSAAVTNVTIFSPPEDYNQPRVLYARTALLSDGSLLATWENYSPEPPPVYFPVYRSTDGGASWAPWSNITDQVHGWGLRYQPFLYVLPVEIGCFPEGTVLAAGNAVPSDLNHTAIDLYASSDDARTWHFVSTIATGGAAIPNNGETPVWEPFLLAYENQLICYYSDQRDPAHGQKLVHQTSSDLETWAAPVDDVAYANYTDRPGMTTVAALPNGQWILTYEYGGGPDRDASSGGYQFPIYYRIASNPLAFGNATGQALLPAGSSVPHSSPYVTWSSVGGDNGTILVDCASSTAVFTNTQLGAPDAWTTLDTPAELGYTRSLRVLSDPSQLLIVGAGVLQPASSSPNEVKATVIEIS